MNKRLYWISAGAVAATSVALITDYVVRKKKNKSASALSLLAGVAGLAASAALVWQPEKEAAKRLKIDDLVTDDDVDLMHENINEVLGNAADRGKSSTEVRRTIELDEEATIEDFMM